MECDKNGIRFLLHFATDCPPGRPDVLVMVASILSTAPLPTRDVLLQAAVPKVGAAATFVMMSAGGVIGFDRCKHDNSYL